MKILPITKELPGGILQPFILGRVGDDVIRRSMIHVPGQIEEQFAGSVSTVMCNNFYLSRMAGLWMVSINNMLRRRKQHGAF